MNLAGLFQYGNKNTGSGTENIKSHAGNSGTVGTSQGTSGQTVKGLTPGQTFQGEVVAKNGNEVQIRIDRDVVITARLDKEMNVSVGQNMTFEVKNNSGVQIALRPLYENMAQDANVLKALEAARLPATDDLVKMVSAMMKQGMSIDKNALSDMSKLIASHPGTSPETMVMMKHMQLPITPENIAQFENYQRYEHQILNEISDILLEIPKTLHSMISAGQGSTGIDFYTQLLQFVTGTEIPAMVEGEKSPLVFTDIQGALEEGTVTDENVSAAKDSAITNAGAEAAQETQVAAEDKMMQDLMKLMGKSGEATKAANGDALVLLLNADERNQLAQLLGKLGFSEEQLIPVRQGSVTGRQLLDALVLHLAKGQGRNEADLLQLFDSKEYHQIMNKEMLQQWLLKPEQVAKKEDVDAYYNKLKEQTMKLTDILGQAVKDTPLAKSLTTMQNNLDFMNQLNQTFQYIQLPLKMSGGEAHGDLYVYTNRKSSLREDGSVSALLHLDMEHLGTIDIHVLMQEKNVSTKFYLADENVIDFIAEHIHVLNERLEKRGYAFQAQMLMSEEMQGNTNVIETLAAGDEERKEVLLAQYSFDVRA